MDKPLLTRADIVRRVREVTGAPITPSTLDKACMRGTGPKPVARFGKRSYLYTEDDALAWARSLINPISSPQQAA